MDCSAVAISAGLSEDPAQIEEIAIARPESITFYLPYLAELPDGTSALQIYSCALPDVLYKRVA